MIYGNRISTMDTELTSIYLFIETFNSNDIFIDSITNESVHEIITESGIGDRIKRVFGIIKDAIIKFGKMIRRFIIESIQKIKRFFTKSKKETQEKVKEIEKDNKEEKPEPIKDNDNQETVQDNKQASTTKQDEKKSNRVYKKIELPQGSKNAHRKYVNNFDPGTINTKDIKQLKYIFVDSLDVDPTFDRYKSLYNSVKQRGLLEPHEDLTSFYSDSQLEKLSEEELEKYWTKIKMDLIKNFSDERMQNMIRIAKILYKEKIQKFMKQRKEIDENEEELQKKQKDEILRMDGYNSKYGDLRYINYAAVIGKLYNSMNTSFAKDLKDLFTSNMGIKSKNKEDKLRATIDVYNNKTNDIKEKSEKLYPNIILDMREIKPLDDLFSKDTNGVTFRKEFEHLSSLSEEDYDKYGFSEKDIYNNTLSGLNKFYNDQNRDIEKNIKSFEKFKSEIDELLRDIEGTMTSLQKFIEDNAVEGQETISYRSIIGDETEEVPVKPLLGYVSAVKSVITDLFSSITTITKTFNNLQIKSISYLNRFYSQQMDYMYG